MLHQDLTLLECYDQKSIPIGPLVDLVLADWNQSQIRLIDTTSSIHTTHEIEFSKTINTDTVCVCECSFAPGLENETVSALQLQKTQ